MSAPVTVDLERWGRAKIGIGLVLCLVLGGGALVGAATGQVDGGTSSVVIAVVLGALILLLGGGICVFLILDPPHASVTVDGSGIRHMRGKRDDWALTWPDVAAVEVTHTDLRVEQNGVSTTGGYLHPSADVSVPRDWLRVTPRPELATRPDLASAAQHDGPDGTPVTIALDLGPDPRTGPAVRAAVAAFAPPAVHTGR